jgi:hypothetical protein
MFKNENRSGLFRDQHLASSDWMVPFRADRERAPLDLKGNMRLRSIITDSVSDLFRALDLRSDGSEEDRGSSPEKTSTARSRCTGVP